MGYFKEAIKTFRSCPLTHDIIRGFLTSKKKYLCYLVKSNPEPKHCKNLNLSKQCSSPGRYQPPLRRANAAAAAAVSDVVSVTSRDDAETRRQSTDTFKEWS